MNRPMPARDHRHRSPASCWACGGIGAVSSAFRLVGGVEDTAWAAGTNSAGTSRSVRLNLADHLVVAIQVAHPNDVTLGAHRSTTAVESLQPALVIALRDF